MIGKVIGHYRLAAELGAGGMGLVYRAHDLKLGREVAVKFLAPDLAQDRKAVERFEREARAAAAINHPNICTIYEVGEEEGQPYIVMELLDGVALRDRIGGEPAPVDDLLKWAIQITEGLEAAHARGILHRDIKPANLFLTSRGLVKILDFGLAKQSSLTRPIESTPGPQTEIATAELLTDPRMTAGTPHYMSPEQARGEELDGRSDLFSLGAVLYEMATGKRPFQAGTSAAILGAVLHERPESPLTLNPELPEELARIIQKALEKDRDLRYQHAGDLRADLKRLRRDASTGQVPAERLPSRSEIPTARKPDSRRRSPSPAALAGTAALIVAIVVGMYFLTGRPRIEPAFQTMTIERLTNAGEVEKAAISPDGKYLAYASGVKGKRSLWVRQIATQTDLQILPPGVGAYRGLTFSRDGNYLFFVREPGDGQAPQLFQVAAIGGKPRPVTGGIDSPVSFDPDGRRFAFVRETPNEGQTLMTASAGGGDERSIAHRTAPDQFSGYGVAWSPDGKWIAASAYENGRCFVMVAPAAGGPLKRLGVEGWQYIDQVIWLSDSSGVLITAAESRSAPEQIWQVAYPGGRVRRVTNDLNKYVDLSLTADSTTLVAVQAETRSNLWTVPDAKSAFASQTTFGAGTQDGVFGLTLGAGGRLIYASITGGSRELWTLAEGGRPQQITTGADLGFFSTPSACPDGHTVVYGSGPLGNANIWQVDIEAAKPRPITAGGTHGGPSCGPDGKWVYFNTLGKGSYSLWRAPLAGGAAEQLTRFPSTYPLVSQDGKRVAYQIEEGNRTGIGIIPSSGGAAEQTFDASFSGPGGTAVLRWSPKGDALDYIDTQNGVSNIWRQPLAGGAPNQVTDFKSGLLFNFIWLSNGTDLVTARGGTTSDAVQIRRFGRE